MDVILPVDRILENDHWVAFHHPQPDYALHILILPKKAVPSLAQASLAVPEEFAALFELAQSLIARFDLERFGYRLITNGGPNQSIPQWHWHLISAAWQESHD
jgi:histidine triad (HIT) family protein